jgi:hypothetical protein
MILHSPLPFDICSKSADSMGEANLKDNFRNLILHLTKNIFLLLNKSDF